MARRDEVTIADLLAKQFKIDFRHLSFDLGNWGLADDYVQISRDFYLLLEVERGQKHPCTNVLKVWPYLEDNPEVSLVLVQAFIGNSSCFRSSRGDLARWLAARIESEMGGKFQYCQLIIDEDLSRIAEGTERLRTILEGIR